MQNGRPRKTLLDSVTEHLESFNMSQQDTKHTGCVLVSHSQHKDAPSILKLVSWSVTKGWSQCVISLVGVCVSSCRWCFVGRAKEATWLQLSPRVLCGPSRAWNNSAKEGWLNKNRVSMCVCPDSMSWERYCTSVKLCGVEQRAPPMFGRATITLGIGPHSSVFFS